MLQMEEEQQLLPLIDRVRSDHPRMGAREIYFLIQPQTMGHAQFAPIRLAIIPMGAYQPQWLIHPIPINPEEGVKVHQEVGSEFSVGMHWGTFAMAAETRNEPPIYLEKAK